MADREYVVAGPERVNLLDTADQDLIRVRVRGDDHDRYVLQGDGTSFSGDGTEAPTLDPGTSEVGRAELESGFVCDSATIEDVTGLTVTFDADGTAVYLLVFTAYLSMATGSGAGDTGTVVLTDDADESNVDSCRTFAIYGAGGLDKRQIIGRVSPPAGSKTYKIQAVVSNAANAMTINTNGAFPASLTVIRV